MKIRKKHFFIGQILLISLSFLVCGREQNTEESQDFDTHRLGYDGVSDGEESDFDPSTDSEELTPFQISNQENRYEGSPQQIDRFEKAIVAYAIEDYKTARALFTELAEQGHAESQYRLGRMYFNGVGVWKRSYKKAFHWYKLAAEQGHAPAQNHLGFLYHMGWGIGVPRDVPKAIEWYKKSAAQGWILAVMNLGNTYSMRIGGVPQDYSEAFKWYEKGANMKINEQDSSQVRKKAEAQYFLGKLYSEGLGVELDLEKGRKWQEKSGLTDVHY